MNHLEQAFNLLRNFSSLTQVERRKRVVKVDRLLRNAERKQRAALLALREVDQLRKQRAYMLITSGQLDAGIKEIESLVSGYDKAIEESHEEAAFQLAEGAIALFRLNRTSAGNILARSALAHAGMAGRISKTVLTALGLMQKAQEKESN